MSEVWNQPKEFMRLDNYFHETIAAATDNPLYLSLSKTIQSLVGVWYPQTFQLDRTKAATLDEHFAIAAAIQPMMSKLPARRCGSISSALEND